MAEQKRADEGLGSTLWVTDEKGLWLFRVQHVDDSVSVLAFRPTSADCGADITACLALSDGRLAVGHRSGQVELLGTDLKPIGHQCSAFPTPIHCMVELPGYQVAVATGTGLTVLPLLAGVDQTPREVWSQENALKADSHLVLLCNGSLVLANGCACHVLTPPAAGEDAGWARVGQVETEDVVATIAAAGGGTFVTGHWFLTQAAWDTAEMVAGGVASKLPEPAPESLRRYGDGAVLLRDGRAVMQFDSMYVNTQVFREGAWRSEESADAGPMSPRLLQELWAGGLRPAPGAETWRLGELLGTAAQANGQDSGEPLFSTGMGLLSPPVLPVALERQQRLWLRRGLVMARCRARKPPGRAGSQGPPLRAVRVRGGEGGLRPKKAK